jgi:hypothetical protein
LIPVFFQAQFTAWDDATDDELGIWFIEEAEIDLGASGDAYPFSADEQVNVRTSTFINDAGSWLPLPLRQAQDGYNIQLESVELYDAKPTFVSSLDWHWFRIDITSAPAWSFGRTNNLSKLKGFSFYNTASSAGEYVFITDLSVFIWNTQTPYWSKHFDFLKERDPATCRSNIGVTFTDITETSMKVITSAPFTGTIRYLCVVHG